MLVNIALVSLGRPEARTTRIASATAAPTPPVSSPPEGLTLKATIIGYCLLKPVGRTTMITRSALSGGGSVNGPL